MKIVKLLYRLMFVLCASVLFASVTGIPVIYLFAGISLLSFVAVVPNRSLAILIFTAPGGVATPFSFNLNFLPMFITWNDVVPLTSLRVSTKERGVIHDLNAAGIAAMSGYMIQGNLPANNRLLRLSTGDIGGQDVTISGVTSAAGAVPLFVSSDNALQIARPLTSKTAQILSLAPTRFEKFTALFIPTLAVGTDRVEVQFNNGHKQIFENQEILALSAAYQEVPGIIINNVNSYIDYVDIRCAAATTAYILAVLL